VQRQSAVKSHLHCPEASRCCSCCYAEPRLCRLVTTSRSSRRHPSVRQQATASNQQQPATRESMQATRLKPTDRVDRLGHVGPTDATRSRQSSGPFPHGVNDAVQVISWGSVLVKPKVTAWRFHIFCQARAKYPDPCGHVARPLLRDPEHDRLPRFWSVATWNGKQELIAGGNKVK